MVAHEQSIIRLYLVQLTRQSESSPFFISLSVLHYSTPEVTGGTYTTPEVHTKYHEVQFPLCFLECKFSFPRRFLE